MEIAMRDQRRSQVEALYRDSSITPLTHLFDDTTLLVDSIASVFKSKANSLHDYLEHFHKQCFQLAVLYKFKNNKSIPHLTNTLIASTLMTVRLRGSLTG